MTLVRELGFSGGGLLDRSRRVEDVVYGALRARVRACGRGPRYGCHYGRLVVFRVRVVDLLVNALLVAVDDSPPCNGKMGVLPVLLDYGDRHVRLAEGLEVEVVGRATIRVLADVGDVFETTGIGGQRDRPRSALVLDKGP